MQKSTSPSPEKLSQQLAQSPLASLEVDDQFRITAWSEKAAKLFNQTASNTIGYSLLNQPFISKPDRQALEQLRKGTANSFTLECHHPVSQGHMKKCTWYISILRDQAQQMSSLYVLIHGQETVTRTIHPSGVSDELLANVFYESMNAIFLVRYPQQTILDCNQKAIDLFEGKDKYDFIDHTVYTLGIDSEKQKIPPEQFLARLEKEEIVRCQLEYQTLKGRPFWGELRAKNFSYRGESLTLVTVSDVSDRQKIKAEVQKKRQELLAQKDLLEAILESLNEGVVVCDKAGKLQINNKVAEQILGRKLVTPSSYPFDVYLPDQEKRILEEESPLYRALQGEVVRDVQFQVRNEETLYKSYIEVSASPLVSQDAQKMGAVAIIRDINERRKYEASLLKRLKVERLISRISSYFINLSLDKVSEGIAHALRQIAKHYAYDHAMVLVHGREEDAQDVRFYQWASEEQEAIQDVLGEKSLADYPWLWKHLRQGREMIYDQTHPLPAEASLEMDAIKRAKITAGIATPLLYDRETIGFFALFSFQENCVCDPEISENLTVMGEIITNALERERQELRIVELNNDLETRVKERTKQLEESNIFLQEEMKARVATERKLKKKTRLLENANQELEAFSYSVSHDLRAPIRSINGFSQALYEDYHHSLDSVGQDFLRRILKASQYMGLLIDGLLSLSRLSRKELNFQRVNLSQIARSVVQVLEEQNLNRQVEVLIDENLEALADPHLMRVVMQNLLENAWKFTANEPKARIEFKMKSTKQNPVFYVKDNGAGFDMKYASKLFGAFQRLHNEEEFKGTGIGLATVRRVIYRHGGKVWAESQPNQGATFYFSLPSQVDLS